MPHHLRIRQEAIDDIAMIEGHYAAAAPEMVPEVREEILGTLDLITERPDSFAPAFADVRRALIRRFHIGIFFHRDTLDAEELVVIAVIDLRRHPSTWQLRR